MPEIENTELERLVTDLKVVVVNGRQYLATVDIENRVISGVRWRSAGFQASCVDSLTKQNTGELSVIRLFGNNDNFTITDLTRPDMILIENLIARFNQTQETAVEQLVNQLFVGSLSK